MPKSGKLQRSNKQNTRRSTQRAAQKATQKANKGSAAKEGQCRIIAGKWRGRLIKFDDAIGLRPTTDRIRETVFNWLQVYIPKSHCLDCFAGSGMLGFEALSRGASEVVFVEKNKATCERLMENGRLLGIDNNETADAVFFQKDTLAWLETMQQARQQKCGLKQHSSQKFDLVFLDPPFRSGLLEKCSTLLNSSGCLAEDAIIYIEHAVDENIVLPENWVCLKEKRSGQVVYKLFERPQ